MIKVIGTQGCSRCMMTKNILTKKNIDFTYDLITSLSQEDQNKYIKLAQDKGFMNFPIIIKNNEIVTLEDITV